MDKQFLEWFNGLPNAKEKAKALPYQRTPTIGIAAPDWPLPCFLSHYFTSKKPKVGELCNCGEFSYREDGYCQTVEIVEVATNEPTN